MTQSPVYEELAALPHFRMLAPEIVAEIARNAREVELAPGASLFHEREPARAFFAIRAGAVRLFRTTPDGRQQVMHTLRAGQVFAEAAVLNIGHYPVNAEAAESGAELIEIDGSAFVKLFKQDERVAAAMVGSLCGWLIRMVERIDELSVASAGARLARHLLHLPASGTGKRITIELPMAKKALAQHLSITPETLSRLLAKWEEKKVIVNEGKTIVVKDADTLEAIAEGTAE